MSVIKLELVSGVCNTKMLDTDSVFTYLMITETLGNTVSLQIQSFFHNFKNIPFATNTYVYKWRVKLKLKTPSPLVSLHPKQSESSSTLL